MNAKNIKAYKSNMGFQPVIDNVICGQEDHVYQHIKVSEAKNDSDWMDSDSAFFFGHDENESGDVLKHFLLSFENDGLLLIGVFAKKIHHEAMKPKDEYTNVYYSLNKKNQFIPKNNIISAVCIKKIICKKLIIQTNKNKLVFTIHPVWDDRIYQIKNYRHLQELVSQLN